MYITNLIQHFERSLIDEAVEYFRTKMPEEACGIFSDNKFIPFVNKADDPLSNFAINDPLYTELYLNNKVDCILHSHDDFPSVSYDDKSNQQQLDIPYGIINFKQKSVTHVIFFGDYLEIEPLKGRPFFYGAFDCLTLVRDYYAINYNIELPDPPKYWNIWKDKQIFEGGLAEHKQLERIKLMYAEEGDIILYKMQGNNIDHCGIYLGNSLMLHHFIYRLSATYPLNIARTKIDCVYRRKQND